MSAIILRADARHLPLRDASVDLVVTSPPHYGLRSYTDGGEHYDGQIGSEATPAEFTAALLACTREWMRVLKPTGSMFVDLGDSYYSGRGAPGKTTVDAKNLGRTARRTGRSPLDRSDLGYPRKSLLLMPERYRIGCLDNLGLTIRAVMVWEKLNALPESVTDRVRRSHEDWVHLTMGPRKGATVSTDLNAAQAAHDYWRKAQESDDTDEWHLSAVDCAGYLPALISELRTLRQQRDNILALCDGVDRLIVASGQKLTGNGLTAQVRAAFAEEART
jgi:hypothetical protein